MKNKDRLSLIDKLIIEWEKLNKLYQNIKKNPNIWKKIKLAIKIILFFLKIIFSYLLRKLLDEFF